MVRLKGSLAPLKLYIFKISIPYGAIKSEGWKLCLLRKLDISIPYGAIKRHKKTA